MWRLPALATDGALPAALRYGMRRWVAASVALCTVGASAVADAGERRVGRFGRGLQLEWSLGTGATWSSADPQALLAIRRRWGLRLDRPSRGYLRAGFAQDGGYQFGSGNQLASAAVDLGAGVRTWQPAGISGQAGLGTRIGFFKIDEALLARDDGDENTSERGFFLAPEAVAGRTWQFSRSWLLGVTARYAPTWIRGTALHPLVLQVGLAGAL